LDLYFKLFDRLGTASADLEATAGVCADDPDEPSSANCGRHGRLSDLHLRKRFAETSGAIWKRLERDMVAMRRVTNHVLQKTSGTGTDIDAVGIGRKRQRKEKTQGVVVAHRAPGFTRPNCALREAQLWFEPCSLGNTKYLAANGDHDAKG
jgi:hypothetical protein